MGRRTRALVIDDSRVMRRAIREQLLALVDEVFEACDGASGLVEAEHVQPDLVLSDIDMPVLDGLGFVERFRAKPANANVPLLLVSGEEDVRTKVRGLELGATDYLVKPFEPAELRVRAGNYLRLKLLQDELVARNRELLRLATTDVLTQIDNRRAFLERVGAVRAAAAQELRTFCVLVGDVDHFKRVNDTLGHAAGDQVLVAVARTLASTVRASDTVARLGGEEFVILLPNTSPEAALPIAERLRTAVASETTVTLSIGVAAFDPTRAVVETVEAVLARADTAVYRAKNRGRNRVEYEALAPRRSVAA